MKLKLIIFSVLLACTLVNAIPQDRVTVYGSVGQGGVVGPTVFYGPSPSTSVDLIGPSNGIFSDSLTGVKKILRNQAGQITATRYDNKCQCNNTPITTCQSTDDLLQDEGIAEVQEICCGQDEFNAITAGFTTKGMEEFSIEDEDGNVITTTLNELCAGLVSECQLAGSAGAGSIPTEHTSPTSRLGQIGGRTFLGKAGRRCRNRGGKPTSRNLPGGRRRIECIFN